MRTYNRRVELTYLGHAGFLVKTASGDSILCDPWFDPAGAYASAWFPFPRNDNVDTEQLEQATHLYVSHWHRDHFDERFLKERSDAFKQRVEVVIARFHSDKLRRWLQDCGYENLREVRNEEYTTDRGTVLFVQRDENPLNADSSITVVADGVTFVNSNDCKLGSADEAQIRRRFGRVDVFTAQFSGATFHPTCYEYSDEARRKISASRRQAKFARIMQSIRRLGARYYIPSAGPALFLTPDLRELNFSAATTFATPADFVEWVAAQGGGQRIVSLAPGESADVANLDDAPSQVSRASETAEYIDACYDTHAAAIAAELASFDVDLGDIVSDTRDYFLELCANVPALAEKAGIALTVNLQDVEGGELHFDLRDQTAVAHPPPDAPQQYRLSFDARWMRALIDERLSWEDFILSFRISIWREPDIYNEAFIAFLLLESKAEREQYLEYLAEMEGVAKVRMRRRIGERLVEHDRYCPHNAEDLVDAVLEGDRLICPRHFWEFSLVDGKGLNNAKSIHLEDAGN